MIEILSRRFPEIFAAHGPGQPEQWQILLLALLAIVIATTVHEFGHAWMADRLGDPTPRSQGRVRLSPFAHIDPLGFLILVATSLIGFPIGWGRPVKTNPENYRCGARKGIALVAAAGPATNILLAILLAPIARYAIGGGFGTDESAFWIVITLAITMIVNISLFVFNLVPVHPLDGSHILASLLPESLSKPYRIFMKQYGVYVLMALIITGTLGEVLGPIIITLFFLLLGLPLP
jgi:Zn-dependent protease